MSYTYLASPYTHPSPYIRELRFLAAELATVHLLRSGQHVYSPIVHCHALAQRHTLPTHFAFWKTYNEAMIDSCRELKILGLPEFEHSAGVKAESDYALLLNKPVSIIDPSVNGAEDVNTILSKLAPRFC